MRGLYCFLLRYAGGKAIRYICWAHPPPIFLPYLRLGGVGKGGKGGRRGWWEV